MYKNTIQQGVALYRERHFTHTEGEYHSYFTKARNLVNPSSIHLPLINAGLDVVNKLFLGFLALGLADHLEIGVNGSAPQT